MPIIDSGPSSSGSTVAQPLPSQQQEQHYIQQNYNQQQVQQNNTTTSNQQNNTVTSTSVPTIQQTSVPTQKDEQKAIIQAFQQRQAPVLAPVSTPVASTPQTNNNLQTSLLDTFLGRKAYAESEDGWTPEMKVKEYEREHTNIAKTVYYSPTTGKVYDHQTGDSHAYILTTYGTWLDTATGYGAVKDKTTLDRLNGNESTFNDLIGFNETPSNREKTAIISSSKNVDTEQSNIVDTYKSSANVTSSEKSSITKATQQVQANESVKSQPVLTLDEYKSAEQRAMAAYMGDYMKGTVPTGNGSSNKEDHGIVGVITKDYSHPDKDMRVEVVGPNTIYEYGDVSENNPGIPAAKPATVDGGGLVYLHNGVYDLSKSDVTLEAFFSGRSLNWLQGAYGANAGIDAFNYAQNHAVGSKGTLKDERANIEFSKNDIIVAGYLPSVINPFQHDTTELKVGGDNTTKAVGPVVVNGITLNPIQKSIVDQAVDKAKEYLYVAPVGEKPWSTDIVNIGGHDYKVRDIFVTLKEGGTKLTEDIQGAIPSVEDFLFNTHYSKDGVKYTSEANTPVDDIISGGLDVGASLPGGFSTLIGSAGMGVSMAQKPSAAVESAGVVGAAYIANEEKAFTENPVKAGTELMLTGLMLGDLGLSGLRKMGIGDAYAKFKSSDLSEQILMDNIREDYVKNAGYRGDEPSIYRQQLKDQMLINQAIEENPNFGYGGYAPKNPNAVLDTDALMDNIKIDVKPLEQTVLEELKAEYPKTEEVSISEGDAEIRAIIKDNGMFTLAAGRGSLLQERFAPFDIRSFVTKDRVKTRGEFYNFEEENDLFSSSEELDALTNDMLSTGKVATADNSLSMISIASLGLGSSSELVNASQNKQGTNSINDIAHANANLQDMMEQQVQAQEQVQRNLLAMSTFQIQNTKQTQDTKQKSDVFTDPDSILKMKLPDFTDIGYIDDPFKVRPHVKISSDAQLGKLLKAANGNGALIHDNPLISYSEALNLFSVTGGSTKKKQHRKR